MPPRAAPQPEPEPFIVINDPDDLAAFGDPIDVTQHADLSGGADDDGVYNLDDDYYDFDGVYDLSEHTVISSRRQRPGAWTLTLPDGSVELVTEVVIVGRAPEVSPVHPMARLVPVADPTRSVSKSHAAFRVNGGVLGVEDLGSTNGIIVIDSDGREVDLGVGGRHVLESGSRVELGDVVLMVGRA